MSYQSTGRPTVYTNQTPFETDVLREGRYRQYDIGALVQAILGSGLNNPDFVAGMACTPVSPPGMSVDVAPGTLFSVQDIDSTNWSVLPADTTLIYKQAYLVNKLNLATPAPAGVGNSIIYLIQVAYEVQDVNPVNRPYYNSDDPNDPIFNSQPDTRVDIINISLKTGVASPSPTPPSVDAGFVGLYYITVANGQTSIITGNITLVPNAPFITESLTQKISQTTGDLRYVRPVQVQTNQFVFGVAGGAANAITVTPTPAYLSYALATSVYFQATATNTGATTANVSGLGVVNINKMSSGGLVALAGGEIVSGGIYQLFSNGTVLILMNPSVSSGVQAALLAGTVIEYAGTTYSAGWALTNGASLLTASYPDLFANIGYQFGGSGANFNLPNEAGRVVVAAGSGAGLTPRSLAQTGGEENHLQTIAEMASHDHAPLQPPGTTGPWLLMVSVGSGGSDNDSAGTTKIGTAATGTTGGNTPSNVMQPFIVYNKFMKTTNS